MSKTQAQESTQVNNISNWFALSVQPGQEKRTSDVLRKRVPDIEEIVVPSEVVKKSSRGQKIVIDRLMFPGYAFIKAKLQTIAGEFNAVIFDQVLAVPGVRSFVGVVKNTQYGTVTTVTPMTEEEISNIKASVAESQETGGRIENALKPGDVVQIISGAFMGMEGVIQKAGNEQGKAHVSISVFGRQTDTELSVNDVELVSTANGVPKIN